MNKKNIKILYTGGTFLSTENTKQREVNDEGAKKNIETTQKLIKNLGFNTQDQSIYNIDSSDIEPKHRSIIHETISNIEKRENPDGYIIIHGTDTMEYSASMLSFMLQGLNKNVILTGSMEPVSNPKGDAPNNLISSLVGIGQLIKNQKRGVYVAFGNKLLQGNKTKKIHTQNIGTFDTPGYKHMGNFYNNIENKKIQLNQEQINEYNKYLTTEGINQNNKKIEEKIEVIKLTPGNNIHNLNEILTQKDVKGIVLEGYGDGNVPTNKKFIEEIKKITGSGKFIVLKSQCLEGECNHKYEGAQKILNIDKNLIISGKNMTTASAITKLMWVLGQNKSESTIKKIMKKNIAGELS